MDPQARIMVVCGKGGVGKTTLSLAFGLKHASEGKRVVIVSSAPLDELAISVSLEGLGRRFPVAARNLFVVHLDPRELLTEVVEKHFPLPLLARAVFVVDKTGTVTHAEYVAEVTAEPNYATALAALKAAS